MIQQNLIKAVVALVAFVLIVGVIGFVFERELTIATAWVVEHIGFVGMCLVLLVSDSLITPMTPDILLIVISRTELAEHWLRHVLILGCISVIAGILGWQIGRWLEHYPWAQRMFGDFKDDHREFIRKYGFWAIAMGSITPLPYSVTCWGAGIIGIRWQSVLFASLLFRIPRFIIYYLLLSTTGAWFS